MLSLLAAAAVGFTVPDSEVVDLPQSTNGVSYELYVHVPPACRKRDAKCPAVYTLDAEYAFPLAATITTFLADRRRIRPVVVVSIAYPDKSHYRPNRTRDYTPFPVGAESDDPNERGSGGGEAFRAVIRDQIIPYVEVHWPVAPGGRTLVGHSYGGLFASNTLLKDPGLFDNYLIVSPSLWYGKNEIFARLKPAAPPQRATPAQVYLAVGSYEEQPERNHAMVTVARRMAQAMEGWGKPRVSYRFDVLKDETHASVFPSALSNGLRAFFGPGS